MKNLIFLMPAVCWLNVALAQVKDAGKVSKTGADTVAKEIVATEDPMSNASWKKKGKSSKEFSDTTLKKDRTVTYDATGNMVISDDADNYSNSNAYPPTIAEYYTQKYPHETYKVLWAKDENGNKIYYIRRKNDVFWFDQAGNFKSTTKATSK